jgi:chromosome segregation ATPase
MSPHDWVSVALAAAAPAGTTLAYIAGRRGRRASASQAEAEAIESLTNSVSTQGRQIDQLTTSLREAHRLLRLADERAVGAETRAAAAELRAATSDAELVRLRGEVTQLRAELASYEATSSGPVAA